VTADKNSVCYGDSAHLCAASGYTTYQWNNTASGVCIYADQSGSYTVTATDAGGCTAISAPTIITVYPPNPASFTISGTTLTASPGISYQWLLNGSAISTAVSQVYTAVASGEYSVQVTDSNGCNTVSTQQQVTLSGIENISSNDFVRIYPNPLSVGNWQLEVSSDWIGSTVEILDASGKFIAVSVIRSLKSEVRADDLPEGVYMMKVTAIDRNIVRKLIRF
jgi:hypothetical protein